MARRRFAPSHGFAGPHVFVPLDDSAWDHERIETEIADIEKRHGFASNDVAERFRDSPAYRGNEAHVVRRYWSGATRFDLEAEGVRDYLDLNKRPEQWIIRPLTLRELAAAQVMTSAGSWDAAATSAFLSACIGLEGVTGGREQQLAALLRARGEGYAHGGTRPTDDAVLEATQAIAYEIPSEVGNAILRLSQDLSDDEKKRSAGPHGGTSPTAPATTEG